MENLKQYGDQKLILLPMLVISHPISPAQVPPAGVRHREKLPLSKRVMKGVLEAMMEKILSREILKSLMQLIILKSEGRVRGP